MRLANVFRLGLKELRGLLRDPILLVLVASSFTLFLYSAARSAPDTLHRATISIVDEDGSIVGERITQALYPPYFTKPIPITQREMDRRMDEGLDTFALDIPPDFHRDLLAGKHPTIQLNVDATRMSQAFTGSGYVSSIVTGQIDEILARERATQKLPVDLALRARFNPGLDPSWFGALTQLISAVTMLAIVLTGAALIREREHGTIEHLLVMPVTPIEIMLSKIWSMSLVVLAATAFSLVFMIRGALHVPIAGSIPLFMVGVALHLFATTSLGITLATLAGSMPRLGMLLVMVLIPLQILSGNMTPRESMPAWIRDIMLAAPNTHFVMLGQAILFRGAGLSTVWPQFVSLVVIGAILFTFSLRRFRRFLR